MNDTALDSPTLKVSAPQERPSDPADQRPSTPADPVVAPDYALYRGVLCRFPWSFDAQR